MEQLPHYLTGKRRRPTWLHIERALGDQHLRDTPDGRRRYEAWMEERAQQLRSKAGREQLENEWIPIRRGWYLSAKAFGEGLLDALGEVIESHRRESYSGNAVNRYDQDRAERLIHAGMTVVGISDDDRSKLPKGELRKCALAWVAHCNSAAPHAWISNRLQMGNPSNMSTYIDRIWKPSSTAARKWKKRLEPIIRK